MTKRALPAIVAEAWTDVVGVGHGRVVVYEDLARDRAVTLRWWRPLKKNWGRKTTELRIERDRRGEPTKASLAAAIGAATLKSAELLKGVGEKVTDAPTAPLTIGETRKALTDPDTGKYPHETPLRREVLRALDYAEVVWGKETPWLSIDDTAWTKLLRRRLESLLKQEKKGVRTTEITISRLATVTTWLRRVKKIPREAGLPPEDWREQLLEHWRGVTKSTRNPEPSRPRHTLDEMRKILGIASVIDPRLDLLLKLGAEYRLGQVVRSLALGSRRPGADAPRARPGEEGRRHHRSHGRADGGRLHGPGRLPGRARGAVPGRRHGLPALPVWAPPALA
jgi:hypothetical protein